MQRLRKILSIGLVLTLILVFGGAGAALFAEENQEIVSPESELYQTVRLMEDTQYQFTQDFAGRALLQDEFADRRLAELEEMIANDNQDAAQDILEDFERHIQEVEQNLNQARRNGREVGNIEELVAQKLERRSQNLVALLEREDLPEQAKAGIAKALQNQERAAQRFAAARQNALENRERAEERIGERQKAEEKAYENRQRAENRIRVIEDQAEENAGQIRDRADDNKITENIDRNDRGLKQLPEDRNQEQDRGTPKSSRTN